MPKVKRRVFTEDQIRAISQALGDTESGITGSEIDELLHLSRIKNELPGGTKWKRLYYSFWNNQCAVQNRTHILEFIRLATQPARYASHPERFEPLRQHVNKALSFSGLQVSDDGTLSTSDPVRTLPEAEQRARNLRATLKARDVHPKVLEFCRAELLADNYFHAVLEAVKSIFHRVREATGFDLDGAGLIDKSLCGDSPPLRINSFRARSERDEQAGFANLLKGIYGMFRNPAAHEPRVVWDMTEQDAIDLLSTASMVHRRLDKST